MKEDALCCRSSQSSRQVVIYIQHHYLHKHLFYPQNHLYTYKCLCDLTMVCELPLRRKEDWPQETMARSCLYISFSSSRTDCAKMTEAGKVNKNVNCFSGNAFFLFWYPTSCAVQWCLLVWKWPDEAPCVGLCIALTGNVFSHLLVQELFAMALLKMQRRYYI